jgi:hypothetical protein
MPRKSSLSYQEIKDIAFKEISKVTRSILFRQLQYQSVLIFTPSKVEPKAIKAVLDAKETNWHFIVVADDYMFAMAKKDKEQCKQRT